MQKDIKIKNKLLFSVTKKDFEIQTFRSSGHGGQNVNKVESGVRIVHIRSGAIGESREERSQHQNKKIAFRRLINSDVFKKWMKLETAKYSVNWKSEKQLLKEVDDWVIDKNLKTEIKEDDKWKNATVVQAEE